MSDPYRIGVGLKRHIQHPFFYVKWQNITYMDAQEPVSHSVDTRVFFGGGALSFRSRVKMWLNSKVLAEYFTV